jgi:hypothetical protein
MIIIDPYSVATVPLEMFFNATPLSIGTSFIWSQSGSFYLITNWHNVTGKDPLTGRHLSSTCAEPNRLKAWLNTKCALGSKFQETIELRDANGAPNWLIHPQLGNQVDVVALPIAPNTEPDWHAINQLPALDLTLSVGHDVFILGYPFGIGPAGLPIWKRGSIAYEPQVFAPDQRYMLVDSASRPGMSGSPVIRRSWGTHATSDGSTIMNGTMETKFVGVYSGRLATSDPLDAQLGLVWPASYVSEIISGAQRDS